MAADGSLRFDTKIDTTDFDKSVSTLEKALDRLTSAVDDLAGKIASGFKGAGAAAAGASKDVEAIGDSAKAAEKDVESLQKQMDAISIEHWDEAPANQKELPDRSVQVDASSFGYDKSAMDFIEQFGQQEAETTKKTSEFLKEVQRLKTHLAELKDSGLYFGDKEYDKAALELKRAEQALARYKSELFKTDEQIAKEAAQQERLNQKLEATRAKEEAAAAEAARLQEIADSAEVSDQAVIELNNRLKELQTRQKDLQSAGIGIGHQEYDANIQEMAAINAELKEYKNQLLDCERTTESAYIGIKDSVINAFRNVPEVFRRIPSAAKAGLSKVPAIARKAFSSAAKAVMGFSGAAKRAFTNLFGLRKATDKVSKSVLKLSNMFKLMLIRMAMRAAIQGVKDGLQNLVQYSDSANHSMSELTSGMTYMKNSFAAAFAPILTYVVPALSTLINFLATAVGYINQFFAALGGNTTFIKAKKVNEDYAKSIKKAGGAAKEAGKDAKKALAPFDELNQLQENASGSGGGGGAAAVDPSEMFETAAIEKGISDFAEKVKALFHAGDWKGLGTIFGQKFNEAVDSIDWNGIGHRMGYGLNGAIQTVYFFLKEADFKNLGMRIAELFNGAVSEIDFTYFGALLVRGVASGLDLFLGLLGGLDWGLIGKSTGDFFIGAFNEAADWISGIDWGAMGNALWLNLKTCVENVDFTGVARSFFHLLGTALAAGVSFIGAFVSGIWEDINKYFSDYVTNDDGTKKTGKDWWLGVLAGIRDAVLDVGAWIHDNVCMPLLNAFKDFFGIHSPSTVMQEQGGFLMEGLKKGISDKIGDVVTKFGEIKGKIIQKWEEVKAETAGKWDMIKSDLSTRWDGIKQTSSDSFGNIKKAISDSWNEVKKKTSEVWSNGGIGGIVSGCINGIISSVEAMVNFVVRAINVLINGINKLSIDIPDTPFGKGFTLGFNIPNLSEVHLPRLATGTVVPPRAGEFAAILGDNRREPEVVSPLSTMKQAFREVLDEVGDAFDGDINLVLNLDGKVIYEEVVKRNQQKKKQTGKNPLLV